MIVELAFFASLVYNRGEFGGWRDEDRDCLDTRQEVLIEESLIQPQVVNCRAVFGLWFDPFTGQTFQEPSLLDVDHMVPLKEAFVSGAATWSKEKKQRYANDLTNSGHLIAVSRRANRSKGSRGPEGWLPSNPNYHCAYVMIWLEVKRRWELSIDFAEARAIEKIQKECFGSWNLGSYLPSQD